MRKPGKRTGIADRSSKVERPIQSRRERVARRRGSLRRPMAMGAALLIVACTISHRDEIRMGQDYASQINAQLPIVRDAETNRYLNLLGRSIARPVDTRNLDWQFFLIDTAAVNAFAVPGGFVYVTRGLVERTDNMSQLAGVLAHEISHVTRRHSVGQMEKAQQANIAVTLACVLTGACAEAVTRAGIEIGGAALFAKYSRDDEIQADDDAVAYVVQAGIHPRGIPQMFVKLLDERRRRPDAVAAWFATHPTEEERIARAQRAIATIDSARLTALLMDTPAFQAFRARVLRPVRSALR